MSTTIDQRVVEMRFDNKQFESNISTSMSTLDKLKKSLNLTGASKGLENVNAASKKVDFSGIGNAVDKISLKFNALYTIADQAFRNITNSAYAYGKRMVSAFTIDPIKTGFQEYETQMNAVQTILANTQSKGTTLDDVNLALDTLNKYADKTIYNFTEMTRNIGTFTAAGIDLDTSTIAIQGIANLAAVSGSNAQQASTAMYQLSQALSSGTVKLMDWNSVVNAGMGGQVFQDALKATARAHGVAVDEIIEKQGSFRESLSEGWITAEILTETLSKMTKSGAAEYLSTLTGIELSQIEAAQKNAAETGNSADAYKELASTLAATGKITEKEALEILKMADNAEDAATKVKTFTQLMDTLKEAAQSGWTQTWELLVGDFEQAKELFSNLSDIFSKVIGDSAERRNSILSGALTSNWDNLITRINEAGIKTEAFENKVKECAKSGGVDVDSLIKKYGSLEKAIRDGAIDTKFLKEALSKLGAPLEGVESTAKKISANFEKINRMLDFGSVGDDVKELQKALSELGFDIGDKGVDGILGGDTTKAIKEFQKAHDLMADGIVGPDTLAALKEAGTSIEEISESTEKASVSVDDLVDGITELGGREMLIESLMNIIKAIGKPLGAMRDAWHKAFPVEQVSESLFGIIQTFYKFTEALIMNEDQVKLLGKIFEGLFALLDIISTVVTGPVKIAFKILVDLLGALDTNFLELGASLSDTIIGFRDWLDSVLDFQAAFEVLLPIIKEAAAAVADWFSAVIHSDMAQDIINGLVNGLRSGFNAVWAAAAELGQKVIDAVKGVLGIQSPSTVMHEAGEDTAQGLINGIKSFFSKVFNVGKNVATAIGNGISAGLKFVLDKSKPIIEKCKEVFSQIDLGSILAGLSTGTLLYGIIKIGKGIGGITSVLEGFGDVLDSVSGVIDKSKKVVKSYSKLISAKAFETRAEAIKTIAIAIAILAGSLIALTLVDTTKLWHAVGAILAIAVILGILSAVVNKFGDKGLDGLIKTMAKAAKLSGLVLAFSASMLLFSVAIKILSGIEGDMGGALKAVLVFGVVIAALVGLSYFSKDVNKIGSMMLKLSIAMLLLLGVAKLASKFKPEEFTNAGILAAGVLVFVLLLEAITCIPGKNIDKVGKTLLKISVALLILTIVAKQLVNIHPDAFTNGAKMLGGVLGFILFMELIALIPGKNLQTIGGTMLKIAAAIAILALTCNYLSQIDETALKKGCQAMLLLSLFVIGLVAATRLAGPGELKRVGSTILMMSVAIGILAGICVVMGLMKEEYLKKGLAVVGLLSLMIAGLTMATRGANDVKGNMIGIAIAIGVMAAAVAALSFIDTTKLVTSTLALSLLMGMFALCVKAAGQAQKAVGALVVMTIAIGVLSGCLYLLSKLPVESTVGSAIALGVLLLALTGSLTLLGMFSTGAKQMLTGVLALTAMAVPMLAFVGVLALMQNIQNATTNAILLGGLMTAMTLLLIPLSIVGAFGAAPFIGIAALITLIVAIGGLVVGIGVLMDQFPQLESFVDKGIPMLNKLANGIGSFVGNIIDGFLSAATASLPAIGANLSAFMTGAMPFISGAKTVDGSVLAGVGVLAASIVALSAADLINGVTSFLSGGSSFATLGTELSNFITNAEGFITGAKDISPEMAEGVKNLATAILTLTAADVIEGLTSWFTGGSSLADFGAELEAFGPSIKSFSDSVKGIDNASVKIAAEAAKTLADMAQSLPNEGGLLGKIFGENSMETFGTQLKSFGSSLAGYSTAVVGIDTSGIEASISVATKLSDFANTIPNEGGLIAKIAGENNMATFGTNLQSFGSSIVAYCASVSGIDTSGVDTSIDAIGKIRTAITDLQSIDVSGVTRFKIAIERLGTVSLESIRTAFSGSIPDIAGVCNQIISAISTSFINAGPNMISSGNALMTNFSEGMRAGSDKAHMVVVAVSMDLIKYIHSKQLDFHKAAVELMSRVNTALNGQRQRFNTSMGESLQGALDAINSMHGSFYNAGSNLVIGFANGIGASTYAAVAAARAMAIAAKNAAEAALDEHSPSRVFYGIGAFAGKGFVNALGDYESASYKSGYNMADSARIGLSKAISRIKNVIDSDMDVTPTIRPVLDLSNVQNGSRAISGMFANQSMALAGINADFTADNATVLSDIISQMRDATDNSNAEVVGAITTLRGDFASLVSAIENMQLTLDSGEVVGGLANKMDNRLGRIAAYKGRGN